MGSVHTLQTNITADTSQFERQTKKMVAANNNELRKVEAAHRASAATISRQWERSNIGKSLQKSLGTAGLNSQLSSMAGGLIASLGITTVTGALASAADAYTRFTNSLKVTGLEGEKLADIQDRLYESALRNGVSLEALGSLYGGLQSSTKDLGISQERLLGFTNAISNAIRVQGGSASAASGAILQLGQALGSAKVQADEYNGIRDGLRAALQAGVDASDKYKGSISKLTEAVKTGKVTNAELFAVIEGGSKLLEERAAKAPLTLAAGVQNMSTAFQKYVGEQNTAMGVTASLGAVMGALATNIDTVMASLTILALYAGSTYAAAMAKAGGSAVLAAFQMTAAERASRSLSLAITAQSTNAQKLAAFQNTMTLSMTRTTVSARALTGAMRLLTSSFGIGLLITGVATAIMALSGANQTLEQASENARQTLEEQAGAADRLKESGVKLDDKLQDVVKANLDAASAAGVAGGQFDAMAIAANNAAAYVATLTDAQRLLRLEIMRTQKTDLDRRSGAAGIPFWQGGGRLTTDSQEAVQNAQWREAREYGIGWSNTGPENRRAVAELERRRRNPQNQRQRDASQATREAETRLRTEREQSAALATSIAVTEASIGTPTTPTTTVPPVRTTGAGPDRKTGGGGRQAREIDYQDEEQLHTAKMAELGLRLAMAASLEERHARETELATAEQKAAVDAVEAAENLTDEGKTKLKNQIAINQGLENEQRLQRQREETLAEELEVARHTREIAGRAAELDEQRLTLLASAATSDKERWALEDQARDARREREREMSRQQIAELNAQIEITKDAQERARLIRERDGVAGEAAGREGVYGAEDANTASQRRTGLQQYVSEVFNSEFKLDDAMLTGLKTLEDSINGVVNGTMTMREAFKNLAVSVVADIGKMIIKAYVMKAIMSALGLNKGVGFGGAPIPADLEGLYASGTNYSKGGLALVGEKGPEIVGLPGGSKVMPNNVLSAVMAAPKGGGGNLQSFNLTTVVNAQNAVMRADIDKLIAQSHVAAVARAKQETMGAMNAAQGRRVR